MRLTGLTRIASRRFSPLRGACGVANCCRNWSNQQVLIYRQTHQTKTAPMGPLVFGAPDRIRTCDPQIRNLVLYPSELRAHC